MKEELKSKIKQIFIAIIMLIIAIIIEKNTAYPIIIMLFIYLIPYLIAGFDVIKEAMEGLREKQIFNEHFLMTIATIGAMIIGFLPNGNPEFIEAVFVMLFFQVGEMFEIIAEGNTEKSINSLIKIKPDYANVIRNGQIEKVNPKTINVGEIVLIKSGEKVPIDGIIIEGKTSLNTLAITGESIPIDVELGDTIISGSININNTIKLKVTKTFEESTVSKIIDLVKNANENKSKSSKFITKFAKVYTPVVVVLAFIIAIIPSIITGEYVTWISRALTFLVVSCPCALVISIPLSYFGGIGAAAKKGILIKGANYLEALSKTKTIVFDKTGTLTEGTFEVEAIHPKKYNEKELLHMAAHVENYSTHPIAISLKREYEKMQNLNDNCAIRNIEELAGLGIKARVNDDIIYVGNTKLMNTIGINPEKCHKIGTIVHIASNKEYLGHIIISDKIKQGTKETIDKLRNKAIRTVMLTGDIGEIAKKVSNELNIDEYYSELLPQDKVDKIEEIINNKNKNTNVAFIGDGINDAPVIARADIGVAMGALGSDAAIEASDIVLMEDKIEKINLAMIISKRTQRICMENIYFALLIKFSVLLLACFGIATMWMAVFADVGVTVLAVLNSMRTLNINYERGI